ncbi:NAD(P)-binding domain-containing protein [Streptomyces sp. H27-C3]|nr:NAD(P)-binding domain-containing protein [Streptomyces sp. H27-C3]
MAKAVAEAGFPLHAWAWRSTFLDALSASPHIGHDGVKDLAAACDIVALRVRTDDDVLQLVTGLLEGLRPGSIVVNHGTGLPGNAVRLTEVCAEAGISALDATVSGGRPAAEERRLTTMVGGPRPVAEGCEKVFASFSRHVVRPGDVGAPGRGRSSSTTPC